MTQVLTRDVHYNASGTFPISGMNGNHCDSIEYSPHLIPHGPPVTRAAASPFLLWSDTPETRPMYLNMEKNSLQRPEGPWAKRKLKWTTQILGEALRSITATVAFKLPLAPRVKAISGPGITSTCSSSPTAPSSSSSSASSCFLPNPSSRSASLMHISPQPLLSVTSSTPHILPRSLILSQIGCCSSQPCVP